MHRSVSLLILAVALTGCSVKQIAPSLPKECIPEIIVLGNQILQDSKTYRTANAKRLRQLDPSLDMLIAVELVGDERLRKIIERMEILCQSQK
jgi:hypothetical protein